LPQFCRFNPFVIFAAQTVPPICFRRVAMNQRCLHCQASEVAVRSESRSLALMRFAQLQRQGHLPRMCESANGQFMVCYDVADSLPKWRPAEAAIKFSAA
jgi:hypothetical protein